MMRKMMRSEKKSSFNYLFTQEVLALDNSCLFETFPLILNHQRWNKYQPLHLFMYM